jgi:hypothetical protein
LRSAIRTGLATGQFGVQKLLPGKTFGGVVPRAKIRICLRNARRAKPVTCLKRVNLPVPVLPFEVKTAKEEDIGIFRREIPEAGGIVETWFVSWAKTLAHKSRAGHI